VAPALFAQAPSVTAVVNAASPDKGLSPGCVATIKGSNLGVGNAAVTIAGQTAPVIIATPSSMNIQIPFELPPGPANIVVKVEGQSSDPFSLNLNQYSPALESADYTGGGMGTFALPNNAFVNAATPATPSQRITLFATGLGPTNPAVPTGTVNTGAPTKASPTVTVNGEGATVNSSALSAGVFGYYEVNFTVPSDVSVGNAPVVLQLAGLTSNTVMLPVGKPNPLVLSVQNSASFAGTNAVAPGELIVINGGNMGSQDKLDVFPATSAEGISFTINNIATPVLYMLPSVSRVYAIVPTELPQTGNGTVTVVNTVGTGSLAVRLAPAVPGIFRIQDPTKASRLNAAALFGNTAWRVMPVSMAAAFGWPTTCKNSASVGVTDVCGQPATAGDNIQVYVTGLGLATPNGDKAGTPLSTGKAAPANGNPVYMTLLQLVVSVGGVSTPVQFSGMAPGLPGVYQVNLQIPKGAPTGDDVAVTISVPGQGSDTATISIH
jgi:uncharacterized protein (TIGR03437 family)